MEATKLNKSTDKLDGMLGGVFMYRGRTVQLKAYIVKDDRVEIKVKEGHPILTSTNKLSDTLNELLPVSNELDKADKEQGMQLFQGNKSTMDDLEDILMDSIKKVQDDPKYLDQAKEINSNANSIIKIAKTKVDMVREMRKLKS